MTNEHRADHYERAAVLAIQASDKNLWRAGYYACRMLGWYQRDGIRGIARDAKRHVSSVENYAHAYEMFFDLQKFGTSSAVRQFRRELTPSHFWKMWSLRNAHDLTTEFCLRYIGLAVAHEWSGDTMIEEAITELGKKKAPKKLEVLYRNAYNLCADLMTYISGGTEMSPERREWVEVGINLFSEDVK